MWHTSLGERVLEGAEARLVREIIDSLIDWVTISKEEYGDLGFYSGIVIFDSMEVSQKIVSLEQAARYLLTPTQQVLELTAVNEAVVGALFEHLRQEVRAEIDAQRFGDNDEVEANYREWSDVPSWRQLIRETRLEVDQAKSAQVLTSLGDEYPPLASSTDVSSWDLQIELLADRILWDRDYELADALMDVDPDSAREHRDSLGISDDYFSAIAPDIPEQHVDELIANLRMLIRQKPR